VSREGNGFVVRFVDPDHVEVHQAGFDNIPRVEQLKIGASFRCSLVEFYVYVLFCCIFSLLNKACHGFSIWRLPRQCLWSVCFDLSGSTQSSAIAEGKAVGTVLVHKGLGARRGARIKYGFLSADNKLHVGNVGTIPFMPKERQSVPIVYKLDDPSISLPLSSFWFYEKASKRSVGR